MIEIKISRGVAYSRKWIFFKGVEKFRDEAGVVMQNKVPYGWI